jgi:hypothetical protein
LKLQANINLDKIREYALSQIDHAAFSYIQRNTSLDAVYSVKTEHAKLVIDGGLPSEQLVAEAQHKELSVLALSEIIIQKNDEAKSNLSAYEANRQLAKVRVRNGISEQEIMNAVLTFQNIA